MAKRVNVRPTLFDYLSNAEKAIPKNKYCDKAVLRSEASVEEFFVRRLIGDLGYKDTEIRPKESLSDIVVGRGRRKKRFRPDYAMVCGGKPRWLIDAKATTEDIDDWAFQGAGYALGLNQEYTNEDPCQYYVITNGLELKVWKWNEGVCIQSVDFSDLVDGNPKLMEMSSLLAASAARKGWQAAAATTKSSTVVLARPAVEEVKKIFKRCHNLIWKAEKMNPQPAFFEFVKIMFVKLVQDKRLHDDSKTGPLIAAGQPIPKGDVTFSTWWIENMERGGVENPVDRILFDQVAQSLRVAVATGKKKPIFGEHERIRVHPGTMKQVVSKMECYDMFGIDEDLNGRLFETFLNATMRGQALGQFFTPRSIVKLMERMAAPKASREHVDRVLDACCGTGGFLIEALTDMRTQIRENTSLTEQEAKELYDLVANEAIIGIDAGQDPPLARIARINMYLHGDGGSRIYAADSLDKDVSTGVGEDQQGKLELEELQRLLCSGNVCDIVLTNPPFSMDYGRDLPNEERILDQYALSTYGYGKTSNARPSLKSRIMFLERYGDLLKPGGRLLTVIDDATLCDKNYRFAREFIREKFIVRAVVSLPGDAFQRVGARVKTSILYLVKRGPSDVGQPDVFMAESSYTGLDDVPPKTPPSKASDARARAEEDAQAIFEAFEKFMNGEKGPWLVPGATLSDRMDVKACLPRTSDVAEEWDKGGYEVVPLGSIVDQVTRETFDPRQARDDELTFLRVRYDGVAERGDTRLGREVTYSDVQRAKENDLVASNIAMVFGAVCVFPKGLEDTLVSSEFTIMRVKDERFEPWFLWGFLRSPEVRARLLSKTTGMNRHRVDWEFLKEIPVPVVEARRQEELGKRFSEAVAAMRNAESERRATDTALWADLNLENEWARDRLRAAKPPK